MPSQRVTISRNARRLQNKIRGTLQGHLPELETITPLLLHVQIRTPFVFTRWAAQLHSKTYGLLYTAPRLYDTQQEAIIDRVTGLFDNDILQQGDSSREGPMLLSIASSYNRE
ncbi:hypothetical protein D6C93_09705 [Aureobasidium pullulans]|nr:hypothetical protein D6C93_09705 [Aureobasidium pullulans]